MDFLVLPVWENLLSVEVRVAKEGGAGTREAEHGQRHWDWDVDSDLQIPGSYASLRRTPRNQPQMYTRDRRLELSKIIEAQSTYRVFSQPLEEVWIP